jgi:hypothetical protein
MEQDRVTAIAGRLNTTPRMIPLEVRLTTSRGHERSFSIRVVQDELLSPALVYMSLLSVLQGSERALGTSTIRMQAKVGIRGGREINVDDLFTGNQPAAQAAALVAAPMAFLLANDLEQVEIDRVEVDVVSHETLDSAVLERAWIERSGPVRPGSSVPLKLLFRTRRGDTVSETIPVSVPASAPAGRYSLLVADGSALTAFEQRQMRQRFVPRTLDQLIRAINGLHHNHYVYARLLRTEDGAIVSGEWLQSLPPSILSVLGSGDQGSTVTRIRTTSVWEFDLKTDYAVTGSRRLNLVVER